MKISTIYDCRVDENKILSGNWVDNIISFDTLKEFGEIACNNHITLATFDNNIKTQSNLHQIQLLGFDFDDGTLPETIHEQCKSAKINHIILASKSHLLPKKDKPPMPRFHLFIPMDKPINNIEMYKMFCKRLCRLYQWTADPSCVETSRYYYKHQSVLYCLENTTTFQIAFHYCWEEQYNKQQEKLKKAREQKERDRKINLLLKNPYPNIEVNISSSLDGGLSHITPKQKFERTKYFKFMKEGKLQVDGERYGLSNQILGAMRLCGLNEIEVMEYFDAYSMYGKSFNHDSIIKRWCKWS